MCHDYFPIIKISIIIQIYVYDDMKDVIRTGNSRIAAMMVLAMTLVTLQRLSTSLIHYYCNMADILGAICKIARVSNFISINNVKRTTLYLEYKREVATLVEKLAESRIWRVDRNSRLSISMVETRVSTKVK